MDSPNYPLAQLVAIKKRRFDQAVKALEEKKEILEKAYEILYDLTQQRDESKEHKTAKLTQLREAMDQGEDTDKIQQMRSYLKVVEEQLKEKEKKVKAQQDKVDLAQKEVDKATEELFQRKKDLEKLEIHKEEWQKEARYQAERKEGVEQDEQGSSTHWLRKKEGEERKEEKKD